MISAVSPHRRYRTLIDEIERRFRIAEWRASDVDLWPIASQDLFLDIFRQSGGDTARRAPSLAARAASGLAVPASNLWKSRHDLGHHLLRPHRADAIFLGDGVSLDLVGGAWRARFGEPVIAALEQLGRRCFVMEPGNLTRLPWARAIFAANRVAARAALTSAFTQGAAPELPDHPEMVQFLEQSGVAAPSLAIERLARRGRSVAAQATIFERILRRVAPATAFVTTYYAGLGHAFALACRRRGILCVDLQHCPHDGTNRAYHWQQLPSRGYSTVPGLFWSWTEGDAASIRSWTSRVGQPWHNAVQGGHAQIAGMTESERDALWRQATAATADNRQYEREILVALQPIGGKRGVWDALVHQIASAPQSWRWWIRRHPASTSAQDNDYAALLSLRRPGVVAGEAAQTPLPALVAHMDAVISLASGAAAEAAMFGVPAFFLDDEARDTFPGAVARREAKIIEVSALIEAIGRSTKRKSFTSVDAVPIEQTLEQIDRLSRDYARLCAGILPFRQQSTTNSIAAPGSSVSFNRQVPSDASA